MKQIALIPALAAALGACAPTTVATAPGTVAAPIAPADLAAIDSAIAGVYAAISGPAGSPRDWNAMRAMFVPGARLTAITPKGVQSFTVDEYIEKSGPLLIQHGFTEAELARRVEVYGNIAHAWSSYHGTTTDNSIDIRGINSFQLAKGADGRWRVQSIFWQPETPALPLPADMVK